MPDLTNFQPLPNAADTIEAEIVLSDTATGETLTVVATLRPRGTTPRTQALMQRADAEIRIARASGTEYSEDLLRLLSQTTSAALSELVAAWDVEYEGAPIDPADPSPLPYITQSFILAGVQEAVAAAPKAEPKPSAVRTSTARKPRPKSKKQSRPGGS